MNEDKLLKDILESIRPMNIFEDFLEEGVMTGRYIFNGADLREAINLAYNLGIEVGICE